MSLVEPVPELNPEMMRPSLGEANALPRVTEPSEEGSSEMALSCTVSGGDSLPKLAK